MGVLALLARNTGLLHGGRLALVVLSLVGTISLLAWHLHNWQTADAKNRATGGSAHADLAPETTAAFTTAGGVSYAQGGRIHIAAIQLTAVEGGIAANMANVRALVREAARRGARYILLPEYFPGQLVNQAGMTLEEVLAGAEDLNGPIARSILELCNELDVYVAFPLAERRTNGKVYNSVVFAGPHGVEAVYSKAVLINTRRTPNSNNTFAPQLRTSGIWQEAELFSPGTTDGVLNWGGVRVGALICADGGFPNLYQMRANKGVQMFCHSSGSSGIKKGEDNPYPYVAAQRYNRPVIFANHWTSGIHAYGNTQICDAQGSVLAHVGPQPNTVVDAVIDLPPVPESDAVARAAAP